MKLAIQPFFYQILQTPHRQMKIGLLQTVKIFIEVGKSYPESEV